MRRRRRVSGPLRWGAPLLCLLLVAGTGACSGGEEDGPVPELTDVPTSSSGDPSPDPGDATDDATGEDGPQDPAQPQATMTATGLDADQQQAADAWLAYWEVLVSSAATVQVDPDALGAVARDEARARVERYVSDLASAGRRLGGGTFAMTVTSVVVEGDTATLTVCAQDETADVDAASGSPVEPPAGPTGLRGTVLRQGPDWIVSDVQNDTTLCG